MTLIFLALNSIFMMINLGMYAWGDHSNALLALGIFNGFAMLLCAIATIK